MQQKKKTFPIMSLVYLVIYLVAVFYNIEHHQKLFVYLWSALFLGNLAYIIYSLIKMFRKTNH
ncbi:hypothetical protein E0E02_06950 [Streptococcus sp. KCJ4932]|uniref:hypothetical protein n=1 Tax=Streptococcus sp. KCJ4932 TaxID=2545465 RepID=UPI001055E5D7|nr:hypothetical protein [Streptococcus sp. KCJ4932]TDE67497.1 hypothetical protein E0E02_06950 [Streptococcus sp. KCJ4932]